MVQKIIDPKIISPKLMYQMFTGICAARSTCLAKSAYSTLLISLICLRMQHGCLVARGLKTNRQTNTQTDEKTSRHRRMMNHALQLLQPRIT